jgi:hypothetical protein
MILPQTCEAWKLEQMKHGGGGGDYCGEPSEAC